MALQNLSVKIGADTSGFTKGLKTMQSGMKSLAKSALALGGITAGVAGLVKAMQSYASMRNSVQRTNELFSDASKYINYFASNTAKAFGMAEATAYEYASTYGNLFKGITSSTEENAKVTIAMLKTSAVVASKTGRTMDDVNERIRSGILGNTEAIEDLGINVPVAMLKTTNAFKSIADGRPWESLTYQEQQQIRVLSIMEQATNQYGDSVSQISGMSLPRLGQAFKDLIGYAGMFVTSALQPIINALGRIVQYATAALKSLAKVLGLKLEGTLASEPSAGAVAQEQFSDATDEATKAAKKQKTALTGFDEVNTLNPKDADTSSSGTSAGGGGASPFASLAMPEFNATAMDIDTSNVENAVDKIKDLLAPLNKLNFEPLKKAFDNLKTSISPLSKTLFDGLIWAYENLFVPLAKWTIEDVAPAFLDALAGASDMLNSTIEALKPLGEWLWDSFLQPIAAWTGGAIVSIISNVGDKLLILVGTLKLLKTALGIWSVVSTVATSVWGLITALTSCTVAIVKQIAMWVANTAAKVAGTAATIASTVAMGAATAAAWLLNAAIAVLASPIFLVVAAIGAIIAIVVLLIKNWNTVKAVAISVWNAIVNAVKVAVNGIKTAFGAIVGWFKTVWNNIKNVFSAVGSWFKNVFAGAWNGIKKVFSGVGNFFKGVWNTITKLFGKIGTTIGDAIGGAFKKVVNSIISFAEKTINGFIKAINKAIKLINKIPGVNISTINELQIPKLARGGIIDGPTVAMVGEAGKEAVMPLENNTGWIDQLAMKIAGVMDGVSGGGNTSGTPIVLNIDGNTFARATVPYYDNEKSRQGSTAKTVRVVAT